MFSLFCVTPVENSVAWVPFCYVPYARLNFLEWECVPILERDIVSQLCALCEMKFSSVGACTYFL